MSIQSGNGKVWKAPNSIHCISTSHAAERLVIRPLTGPPLSAEETQSIIAVQQTLWQEKWRSCLLIDCFLINTLRCTLNHLLLHVVRPPSLPRKVPDCRLMPLISSRAYVHINLSQFVAPPTPLSEQTTDEPTLSIMAFGIFVQVALCPVLPQPQQLAIMVAVVAIKYALIKLI